MKYYWIEQMFSGDMAEFVERMAEFGVQPCDAYTTPAEAWAAKIKEMSDKADKAESNLNHAQGELEACEVARDAAQGPPVDELEAFAYGLVSSMIDKLRRFLDERD